MNGRRTIHFGTVGMLLVLALATMGVGYGLWSQVLTIEGFVATGNVNAIFIIEEVDEGDISNLFDDGISQDEEFEGKDVAECDPRLLDGLDGPQLMEVLIKNGYPSFWCFVNFSVRNTGSIPIKLEQPVLVHSDPGLFVDTGTTDLSDECYFNEVNGSWDLGDPDRHPQLEPQEETFCTVAVHVEQNAAQGRVEDPLRFTVSICAHQWNEEPFATPGGGCP